jgi:hypothetical protein
MHNPYIFNTKFGYFFFKVKKGKDYNLKKLPVVLERGCDPVIVHQEFLEVLFGLLGLQPLESIL